MVKLKLFYVVICVFFLSGTAYAYLHKGWSAKELTEKADLIVIATPIETSEATGKSIMLLDIKPAMHVVEMETKFEIKGILKGKREELNFTLVHYFYRDQSRLGRSGPSLRIYKIDKFYREFLMFLKYEGEGIYTPVSGQTNPNYAIRLLSN